MANRDVTITLKVKDGEVVAATSSLNRMKAAAQDVGRTAGFDRQIASAAKRAGVSYEEMASRVQRASVGVKQAESAINATAKAASGLAPAAGGAAAGMGKLGAAAGPIGAALLAVGVAIGVVIAAGYKLAQTVLQITKTFADYAAAIGRTSRATGLAVETIAALQHEADATGESFGRIETAVNRFRETLGKATAGNRDARAALKGLGIDGTKAITDIDAAFKNALRSIYEMPDGIEKARAAHALLGDEWYKLIPLLDQFNGNVDLAVQRARELGIVMSEDDVKAAREFNRAYAEVQAQLRSLSYTFGREFLPTVRDVISDFSKWIKDNKSTIDSWATAAGDFVRGTIKVFRDLLDFLDRNPILTKIILGFSTPPSLDAAIIGAGVVKQYGSNDRLAQPATRDQIEGRTPNPQNQQDLAVLNAILEEQARMSKALIQGLPQILNAMRTGTMMQESGGNQFARNARTSASGLFQVMPANVGPWTKEVFGRSFSVEEFMHSPKAQEAVFNHKMGQYLRMAAERANGNEDVAIRMAAAAWYGGPGAMNRYDDAKRFRPNEPSFREYTMSVLRRTQAARQGGGSIDPNDIEAEIKKSLAQRSDILTKEERDRITQAQIDFLLGFGMIADEKSLARIQSLIAEDAKSRGVAQPTAEQVRLAFEENKASRLGPIDVPEAQLGTVMNNRLTADEEWVQSLRDGLGISQRIGDLVFRQRNMQAELGVELENQSLLRKEIALDLEKEYQVLLRRNLAEEAANAHAAERNQLVREIGDLEIRLANLGRNDNLRIQAAHLNDILQMRERELDAVIRINRAQLELSQSMRVSGNQIRAQVLEHLASQRTLNEAIADGITRTYDEIGSRLDEQIEKMFEWAGALRGLITEPLKAFARNSLTRVTRGLLDALIPGLGTEIAKTQNPIARPIVDEIGETNKRLDRMIMLMGGAGGGSAGVGGFLSRIFSGIGGGGGGTGLGSAMGGSAIGGLLGLGGGAAGRHEAAHAGARGSGSILGNLRQLFSTGQGGIFAPRENALSGRTSRLGGIMGGIGDIATVAGGIIGGRFGGILSAAGTGASIGAMFGPWGAAIGAGIGALFGLFGGDPKRKADKRQNIPALNSGFADAIAQLREILTGVRRLSLDPDEAVSRANEVRAQIASGFGIQFQSKKYRRQAQTMIAAKLREADDIISQIRGASDIARGAADRRQRILPEFAGGFYFPDYFRPNGLIPGVFDGRDDLLAMLTRGEMVLNPEQQNRARAAAGFDVFSAAGIPNYPKASSSPKLARGGIVGTGLALGPQPNVIVEPRFSLYVEGVNFDERARAWIESDGGRRTFVKVFKQERKGDRRL